MELFYANMQFIGGTNVTFRVLFALHRGGQGRKSPLFKK